jgi:hypothetical protein
MYRWFQVINTWVRAEFIAHPWVETDDEHRECPICGRTQERDTEVEILGPNPWFTVKPGNLRLHNAPVVSSTRVGNI